MAHEGASPLAPWNQRSAPAKIRSPQGHRGCRGLQPSRLVAEYLRRRIPVVPSEDAEWNQQSRHHPAKADCLHCTWLNASLMTIVQRVV
jgi:hypothetical protein